MKKTFVTILKAGRYSLAFCWRNQPRMMLERLALAIVLTLLSYAGIFTSGLLINTVQEASAKAVNGNFYSRFVMSGLMWPIMLTLGVFLSMRLLSSYSNLLRGTWNQTMNFSNRRELQEHRATLDVARVKSKEFDDLDRRISELPSGWSTRISFSEEMLGLLTTVFTFITFGSSLLWYNPYYALVILATSIPMMFTEFEIVNLWWNLFQSMTPEHKKRWVLEKPYRGDTTAFVQALMFDQMPYLRKKIDVNVDNILEIYNRVRRTAMRKRLVVNCLTIFGLVGVILHASMSVISIAGGLGTLTIIIGAARTFQGSLESIVSLVAEQWNNAKGVILTEEDFLSMKPLIKTEYPVIPPQGITPDIVFENVNFSYPDRKELVLKNISCTFWAGSKVAIVGASGNGKSTLVALMMRNYDPTSGNILAGGINLRNICPSEWSKVASCLTQDYTVLQRPIGEEIASSRLDAPIDTSSVMSSANFANFTSVIESDPEGLASQIGTEFGGRDFSGGERQRLALARVQYRGTPVLILDEPDAKLDAESAQMVIDNIFALTGVTVVLITHHVSRAEKCDHIIVMGKGKVVEQGTHEELMALGGTYVSIREKDRERLGARLGVQS